MRDANVKNGADSLPPAAEVGALVMGNEFDVAIVGGPVGLVARMRAGAGEG